MSQSMLLGAPVTRWGSWRPAGKVMVSAAGVGPGLGAFPIRDIAFLCAGGLPFAQPFPRLGRGKPSFVFMEDGVVVVDSTSPLSPSPRRTGAGRAQSAYCCRKSRISSPPAPALPLPFVRHSWQQTGCLRQKALLAALGITSERQGAPSESPLLINVSHS